MILLKLRKRKDIIREEENISKLRKIGISYELSKEIVVNLKKKGKNFRYDDLKNEVLDMFVDYIKVDFFKRHKYYVFIGSTGVGKTTTLAKIASKETIENKKRIGFLTLDTYRISAVEQLKTYAEILSSPNTSCKPFTRRRSGLRGGFLCSGASPAGL